MTALKWGFGLFLVAAAIFVLLYTGGGNSNERIQDKLSVYVDPADERSVVIAINGSIYTPLAHHVSRAYDEWKDDKDRFVIRLNSPGGDVKEGERIISLIGKMKKKHKVVTYVGAGQDCLSMCVPIYLQGELRIAAADSSWLFHDARAYDPVTGTELLMNANEQSQSSLRFFNRYIDRSDVNPKWRDRLRRELDLGDVWKTGQDLKDERSNIIMILE